MTGVFPMHGAIFGAVTMVRMFPVSYFIETRGVFKD